MLESPLILYNSLNSTDNRNNNIEIKDEKIINSIVKIKFETDDSWIFDYKSKEIETIGFLCNIKSKKLKSLIIFNNNIDEKILYNSKKLKIYYKKNQIYDIDLKESRYILI